MADSQTTAFSDADAVAMLQDAITYAFVLRDKGGSGFEWLDAWRYGDAESMAELDAWQKAGRPE